MGDCFVINKYALYLAHALRFNCKHDFGVKIHAVYFLSKIGNGVKLWYHMNDNIFLKKDNHANFNLRSAQRQPSMA